MNWINRFLLANWSHIFDALLLTIALLSGIQIGESRVQKAWEAEQKKIALAQAKQEQYVADVRLSQSQISQEISNEYEKSSKLLSDRRPDTRFGGMCNVAATSGRDMPPVPETSARAARACTDPLPAPSGDAGEVSCARLASDAAQTTLMLEEMQRWYLEQSAIQPLN